MTAIATQHTVIPLAGLNPTFQAATGGVITAPVAPTLALATGTNLGTGAYRYQITFVTSGETVGGTEATITTTSGNQAVSLSAIPLGPTGTTKRGVYRTAVGGAAGTEKLVAFINNNTATTYSDTLADGSLGVAVPTLNTAAPVDTYTNTGKETLNVKNVGAVPVTVTCAAFQACNQTVLHPINQVVNIGITELIGPLSTFNYDDANNPGLVEISYSTTVQAAPGAATLALLPTAYGLGAGVYRYAVTFVNASGETTGGTEVAISTVASYQVGTGTPVIMSPALQAVSLSGIPLGPGGTTQRKIYRTVVGGASATEHLVATLADNTTTTYTDTIPDASLGAAIPTTNTAAVPPPGAAATATAAGTTLGVGVYRYQVTFTNAGGETTGGVEFQITTTTNNTNVALTSIPLGPTGTTSRKIYRTSVGGAAGSEKLLTTLADNTTTTYTDSTADGSLGAAIPTTNAANVISVAVTAP